jgi:hypothetical protein
MISRNLSLLAMVALFCMIFVGLTQTAPLNKRDVAYADFGDGGFFGFLDFTEGSTRVRGQFNRGFEKDTNIDHYEFIIVERGGKNIDLTKGFRDKVNVRPDGSTAPFIIIFEENFVLDIVGGMFTIRRDEKIIAKTLIKYTN